MSRSPLASRAVERQHALPMPLVPANVERMIAYKPGKPIEELERQLGIRGAVKLASNENPLGPAAGVVAAVREAASKLHIYPDGAAHVLREALAAHLQVELDELVLGNGSNELIDLICRTYPDAAIDHVVFGKPSFVCYWLGCIAAGVDFTEVALRDDLHWNVDDLLAAVTEKTKVLFVANPNNPTGAYLPKDELRRLLAKLPPRVVAVIDEAYFEFPDAPDYQSAWEMRDVRERLLVLRTFSKAYGIAGARVGYAMGPRELVGYLHRMRAPFNVNVLGQVAAHAALREREHVANYVALNTRERARLATEFQRLGLRVAPSQGNFVLVKFDRPGAEIYDALLRKGVIVRPMPSPIDFWLRITVGNEAMNDRLLDAVAQLG